MIQSTHSSFCTVYIWFLLFFTLFSVETNFSLYQDKWHSTMLLLHTAAVDGHSLHGNGLLCLTAWRHDTMFTGAVGLLLPWMIIYGFHHLYLVLTVRCDCIYIWPCTYYMWCYPSIYGSVPSIFGYIRSNPRRFSAFSTVAVYIGQWPVRYYMSGCTPIIYGSVPVIYGFAPTICGVAHIYIWFCSTYIWSCSLKFAQFSRIFHGSRYTLASQWSVWRLYVGYAPAIHDLVPVISGFVPIICGVFSCI